MTTGLLQTDQQSQQPHQPKNQMDVKDVKEDIAEEQLGDENEVIALVPLDCKMVSFSVIMVVFSFISAPYLHVCVW